MSPAVSLSSPTVRYSNLKHSSHVLYGLDTDVGVAGIGQVLEFGASCVVNHTASLMYVERGCTRHVEVGQDGISIS
jgi:hypothetical protein